MKEHGGDLDRAVMKFGGKKSEWIDLSTGINPNFYPVNSIENIDIHPLPSKDDIKNLIDVARKFYNTNGLLNVLSGSLHTHARAHTHTGTARAWGEATRSHTRSGLRRGPYLSTACT